MTKLPQNINIVAHPTAIATSAHRRKPHTATSTISSKIRQQFCPLHAWAQKSNTKGKEIQNKFQKFNNKPTDPQNKDKQKQITTPIDVRNITPKF